jgi:hypothetical protein
MSLLALLKARSHSQDIAGQADISKGQRWGVGEGFYIWLTPPGYRIKLLSGGVPLKISFAFWVYIGIPVAAAAEL